jgi:hypothetical protein
MKAKRYKITIYESALDITHGFGQTIDEIAVGDIFINSHGVFDNYGGRGKGATDVIDIEFDELLYNSLKYFLSLRKSIDREIKRILKGKGDVKSSGDTPITCYDDFEKKYLPRSRKERLEALETPEQTGERLAKETLERIKKDLEDKPKKAKK